MTWWLPFPSAFNPLLFSGNVFLKDMPSAAEEIDWLDHFLDLHLSGLPIADVVVFYQKCILLMRRCLDGDEMKHFTLMWNEIIYY